MGSCRMVGNSIGRVECLQRAQQMLQQDCKYMNVLLHPACPCDTPLPAFLSTGGIDLLVSLLASSDLHVAEVARHCLSSVRAGNPKNQRETAAALRASTDLARDMRKLGAASDLLRYEDGTSSVRSLIEELDVWSAKETVRLRSSTDSLPRPAASTITTTTAALNLTPPRARTPLKMFDSGLQRPSSASTMHYTTTSIKDHSLIFPGSPGGSVAPSVAATIPAAGDDWKLGTTLVELESELLRKKHLARFACDEVCLLLEEMGFDALDLRGFRLAGVSGARLLGMTEDELLVDMLLVRSKARKVQQLQRATQLFDRISSVPRQGRVSEIELRLYLAGQGASSSEVNKVSAFTLECKGGAGGLGDHIRGESEGTYRGGRKHTHVTWHVPQLQDRPAAWNVLQHSDGVCCCAPRRWSSCCAHWSAPTALISSHSGTLSLDTSGFSRLSVSTTCLCRGASAMLHRPGLGSQALPPPKTCEE